MKYIQRGRNNKYPNEIIDTWGLRDTGNPPEWISDNAKVMMDLFGDMSVTIRNTTSGGFEIITADGVGVLVRAKTKEDVICYGDNRIFSLTPIQLNLLYEKKK